MPYPLISTYNMSAGMQVPFQYVNVITAGVFINMLLASIWIIFAMGSYFMSKRRMGVGDFPQSLAVAGFVTTTFAFLLRMIPDLVSGATLVVCFVITSISVVIFLFSREHI